MGGRAKALLPHPDRSGRPLVRAAAEALAEAGLRPVVAVLGCRSREVSRALKGVPEVRVALNPAWRSGMLSSLRCGAREAARRSGAGWFVIAPADQPYLSAELVRRVLGARRPDAVAAAAATEDMERAGSWGHPVALARKLLPELAGSRDADRGAAALLRKRWERVAIARADARELLDVDAWDEYLRARETAG